MPTSVSQESQNLITPANESVADNNPTWNEMDVTWDDEKGTWNLPGVPLSKESQNSTSVSNETKN